MQHRRMDVEVSIVFKEISDVVGRKVQGHTGEVGWDVVGRRIKEVEDLIGKFVVRIMDVGWYSPGQVAGRAAGTGVC